MYLIDKENNRIEAVTKTTFSELGFSERTHLQEWLANNPKALGGEELLIIQKEFDGFNDTRERLDLLALDKQGNIVVIENKLDDSGRDVTWQVLKYASYCSSLKPSEIVEIYQKYLTRMGITEPADKKLLEFFDIESDIINDIPLNKGLTQRVIMVAAEFRKEVTSTVLWLLNYKLRIQLFKVTPYIMGDKVFIDFDQIIPMKSAEVYTIKMAEKTQEEISNQEEQKERYVLRQEFWVKILKIANEKFTLFQNISPSKQAWIGTGSGVRGIAYNFVISKNYGRCEIYIDRGDVEENKMVYDLLLQKKEKIEEDFGGQFTWERLDEKRACRIKYENSDFNVFDRDQWPSMIDYMVDGMIRMEQAFKTPLKEIQKKLKTS